MTKRDDERIQQNTMSQPIEMPRWLDLVVLPAFNLALALLACGVVVLIVGQDPAQVLALLIDRKSVV